MSHLVYQSPLDSFRFLRLLALYIVYLSLIYPILQRFVYLFIYRLFILLYFFMRTEFHSLQGMEFLEGFGKKKQQPHQQLNNLSSIHINPLSAQSLNIHLHGILFLSIFFILISQMLLFAGIIFAAANLRTIRNNLDVVIVLFLALFAAVEHGHLDKARTILESTDVEVNRWVAIYIIRYMYAVDELLK